MNLREATTELINCLASLQCAGFTVTPDDYSLRVHLWDDDRPRHWLEINDANGDWRVQCASGPDAYDVSSDVMVPREAFDQLVQLAKQSLEPYPNLVGLFAGTPSQELAVRAVNRLVAAGLIPKATTDADKHEPALRACHLVHDHDGHEPHTWTDVDSNWLRCPGSGTPEQTKPEPCVRCRGRGYVPDFSGGLDPVYGEPGKKPCPACQAARPEPSPLTARGEARCLSQFASKDGVVQCREKVGHGAIHQSEAGTNRQMGGDAAYCWKTEAQL